MVFRKISVDIKERALWLLLNDYITEDVCEILGVSERSIQRWKAHMREYGSVVPPKNPFQGRPRRLTADQTHGLLAKAAMAPEMYLDEIQDWMALEYDNILSRTSISRLIADAGITYKRLRRAAAERDDEARSEWLRYMQTHILARQVVTTDESSKDDRTIYRHYGRAATGQRATITAGFNRGTRYSILPAMSIDGYLATRVMEGSVDGAEFFDFIVSDVLPKMNPFPEDRSVLVLDNCAIHKTDALREVVEAAGCLMIFLPTYSPDFNPIEESFSSIKYWLRRHYRRALESEHPEAILYEACASVTPEKAAGWFRHSGYRF